MNVECAFRILSLRFQIFRKPIAFLPDKVDLITMTCCTLYNLLISDVNEAEALNMNSSAMNRLQHMGANANEKDSRLFRDEIANYCIEQGNLEWQYSKI